MNTSMESPEKQSMSGFSAEVLAQVSSYLNLPSSITSSSEQPGSVQAEILPIMEDGANVVNSFLTAALTSGSEHTGLAGSIETSVVEC